MPVRSIASPAEPYIRLCSDWISGGYAMSRGIVLAIDDDADSLLLIACLLGAEGYNVLTAASGEAGLAICATAHPDIILLDIRMPGMDGYETCRRLKVDEATRHIPVGFLSAARDSDECLQGFLLGAVDFISKPYQTEELLPRVRHHLGLERLRRDLEDLA